MSLVSFLPWNALWRTGLQMFSVCHVTGNAIFQVSFSASRGWGAGGKEETFWNQLSWSCLIAIRERMCIKMNYTSYQVARHMTAYVRKWAIMYIKVLCLISVTAYWFYMDVIPLTSKELLLILCGFILTWTKCNTTWTVYRQMGQILCWCKLVQIGAASLQ